MKKDVFHEGRQGKVLSLGELLISAGVGGIPAGESHSIPPPPDPYLHHKRSRLILGWQNLEIWNTSNFPIHVNVFASYIILLHS
jgi:hypothetical protein